MFLTIISQIGLSWQVDFQENINENIQLAHVQQEVEYQLQVQECKNSIY